MGYLQLSERAPVASVASASLVSQALLAFYINQLDQGYFSPLCYPFLDAVLLRESLDPTRAGPH